MRPVGVPNILAAQRLALATSTLRSQSETARNELTTGRIADHPSALGAGLGEALSLRGAIDALSVRRQGLAQAALISSAAQRSLGLVGEGARAVASDALAANGRRDDAGLAVAAAEATTRLDAAFSALNVRIAGQSIFAGDASDRPALTDPDRLLANVAGLYASAPDAAAFEAALNDYFDDPTGGFQTTIFTGGAGSAPSIEVDAGERLDFTLRADDAAIRDLLRGLATVAVAAAAPASALRDGALAQAGADSLTGADALALRQAGIGVAEARAATARAMLETEEAALTEAYNALTARDPLEAAARLQSLESQLSAALTLTARISQLSLTNFLR